MGYNPYHGVAMEEKDPLQALGRGQRRLIEETRKKYAHAKDRLDRYLVDLVFAFSIWVLAGSQPVAAQSGGSGELDQLVTFLNDIAGLLQRVGIALAVLGLSAAGIAYIVHKKRSAKSIAQSVIIGTVILLLSGAAVDYLAQGLA